MQFIRTIVSRVLAAPLGAAASYLVGVGVIPPEMAADAKAAVILFVATAVYGIAHKLFDGVLNPNDDTAAGDA